ncbi:MAG: molybdenum cofactor guanylyltransferase [Acidocella sp. 20-61-6]|nr:MAG: molybdenum cofactor guanylyltransferase [Acidocella sp. 20-61-6]
MIAALILAGGRGSRLGGADKAFLTMNGQPLIAHLLARLTPQVPTIAISANGDPTRFAAFGLPVLPDLHRGKGPLAGVAAGLAWAADIGAAALLTVPVDTPYIPHNLAERLAPAPSVSCYRGRQHHLAALWPVDCLPMLERFLEPEGKYKVRDFLKLIRARQVSFNAPYDPFLNINTPEDLEAATALQAI